MSFLQEDLIGRALKGFFQRVEEELIDMEWMISKILNQNDEPFNKEYFKERFDFKVYVFHYDPKSGLFIAKGEDILGESVFGGG